MQKTRIPSSELFPCETSQTSVANCLLERQCNHNFTSQTVCWKDSATTDLLRLLERHYIIYVLMPVGKALHYAELKPLHSVHEDKKTSHGPNDQALRQAVWFPENGFGLHIPYEFPDQVLSKTPWIPTILMKAL